MERAAYAGACWRSHAPRPARSRLAPPPAPVVPARALERSRMSLDALRVMVVEDHGFQRRMALRLLGDLGVKAPMEAADGAAALALLDSAGEVPDVVLVDLDMPGMDGIEFIGHVAQKRLARAVAL